MRREIGHSRVPAPPDRIMGMILVISEQISREYLIAHIIMLRQQHGHRHANISGADDSYLIPTHSVISRLIRGFLSVSRNSHATAHLGEWCNSETDSLEPQFSDLEKCQFLTGLQHR